MTVPEPVPPKKDFPWVWVVVVLVVLCLCCALAAAAVSGYYLLKNNRLTIPNFQVPGLPTLGPSGSTSAPSGPLTVQPYNPNSGQLPTLQSLVSNWQGSTTPAVSNWQVQVSASQPAVIFVGWCTKDQATLDQNYQHLTWIVEVDGKTLPTSSFYVDNAVDPQQGYCRSFAAEIAAWTGGQHTIKTTMRLDQQINDGWSDYAAGDYVDIYAITVTP